MVALLVVEKVSGRNLWNVCLPDGERRTELTAVEVHELAYSRRLTCVSAEEASAYDVIKARCLALVQGLAADEKLYCAPDREGEEPPEGTITPSKLQAFLAANGLPGCAVALRRDGVFEIDPPLPLHFTSRIIKVPG
jgi:hypothetical protein